MKVYVLIGDGPDTKVLGAFSSDEKAKDYFRASYFYTRLDIYELTVDEPLGTLVTRLERKDL